MSQTKITDAVRTVTAVDGTKINAVDGAKITTGTIPEARITSLDATKLTGNIASARIPAGAVTQHVTGYNDASIRSDILKLALHQAIDGNRIAYNLDDSFIDGFEDDTGITTETTVDRNTAGEYVSSLSTVIGAHTSDGNTTLLLNCDGSNNGTTFTDSSSHNRTITRYGAPVTATGNKQYGTASCFFSTGANGLSIPDDNAWYLMRSSDFTIECWLNLTALPSGGNSTSEIYNQSITNGADAGGAIHFDISTNGNLYNNVYQRNGSSTSDDYSFHSGEAIPLNTWKHVVLTRQSNTLRMYIDGVQKSTHAISSAISYQLFANNLAGDVHISKRAYSNGYGFIRGSIDDYRISNICRYPDGTTFTPGANVTNNATGTLISDPQTASTSRTSASGVIIYEDGVGTNTLGTDLKIYFSCNNSAWTEANSYGTATTYSGTKKLVKLGATTCTAGTAIAMKAVWANQSASKEARLHGWAVNY